MTPTSPRDLAAERHRSLPATYRTEPLNHWTTIVSEDNPGFYDADHGRCVLCGLIEADHYRRTMLDDIYQLGYCQVTTPFGVWPPLPLFLERRVRLV